MSINPITENEAAKVSLVKQADMWLDSLGYGPIIETYKSFGEGNSHIPERFCIERRLSPNGRDVVIKLASDSDTSSLTLLEKEAANLIFLNNVLGELESTSEDISYKVPKLYGQIKGDLFAGIETEYCEDDRDLRFQISSATRYEIFEGMFLYFQKIEPSENVERESITHWYPKVIQNLREKGLIDSEQEVFAREIIMNILPKEESLIPECIVHGDIHGQNIQVTRNKESEKIECTIMDVESMKRGSPYIDIAVLYVRGEVAKRLEAQQDGPLPDYLEKLWMYDLGTHTEDLKRTAIGIYQENAEISESIFRAHVLFRAMSALEYNSQLLDKYPLYENAVKIERELIQEQLAWFEDHQSVINVFKTAVAESR